VDLYSCFPSAVQVAAAELGLGLDRPLTVTGGLTFAGGPWNNYVTHGIATMMTHLRADPEAYGLCTANGGHLSKHAVGVYSCRPPAAPLRVTSPQETVDAGPSRQVLADAAGEACVETFTVVHGRDGRPERGFVACLDGDGRRALVATDDPDDLQRLLAEDPVGATVKLTGRTLRL
jgi:acetyl-CoA C-acetyltransferase